MIASVFTPDGIVLSTLDVDCYYNARRADDPDSIEVVRIAGHPHVVVLADCYALMFKQLDEYVYHPEVSALMHGVLDRWQGATPPLHELMPYVKKLIVDHDLQIIGIMAGYSPEADGSGVRQHVYQILGSDIRRINLSNDGRESYNCVFLEKETLIGRLLRDVRVKNGDIWEDHAPMQMRCELFSLDKAVDTAAFLLNTANTLGHLNTAPVPHYDMETVVITPSQLKYTKTNHA